MKKNFLKCLLAVALVGSVAVSFVSCKDDYADLRTELQGQISTKYLETLNALEDAKKDLLAQINDLKTQLKNCEETCNAKYTNLEERVAYLESRLADLEALIEQVKNLGTKVNDLENKVNANYNELTTALDALNEAFNNFVENNEDNVNALIEAYLQEHLKDLLSECDCLSQEELETLINNLIKTYLENSNYVTQEYLTEELKKYVSQEEFDSKVTTIVQGLLDGFVKADELESTIRTIVEEYGYLNSEDLEAALQEALKDYVTNENLEEALKDFLKEDGVKTIIEEILAQKDYVTQEELTAQLDSLAEVLRDEVDAKIDALREEIKDLLSDILARMITSIEINATENPIFGSASLPLDLRTTLLGAYYGRTAVTVQFPSAELAQKVGITPMGWDAGQILLEDAEGNAGTLYMTINPNTVDFAGQSVKLVTSQGNESPIKLSTVKDSEKELSFGYTRANANGFYEVAATLNKEDIENAKVSVDLGSLKDAAKTALEQRSKSSVARLAATLLNEASSALNMPAYAVKASWSDDLNGTEHSVLSQYAIATTAVKPLSYDFMKDAQYDIPGIERFENFVGNAIDKMFDEIKNLIPDFSDLGEIKLREIQLRNSTRESLKIEIKVTIPADQFSQAIFEENILIYDEAGNVIGSTTTANIIKKGSEYEITYELDLLSTFDEVIKDMNDSLDFDELNDALQRLSELADLNSDLDDLRDRLRNGLFGYIDRLNSAFKKLVGSVNTALQPCLLFTDAKGNIHRVTTSTLGTQVTGTSITLAPTSYTAELFAPAFKKFIAITDVKGGSKSITAYNKGDFGKVLSGNTKTVELTSLEKGCTYEITYSALDYAGNTRTKKFYISVK